MNYRLRLLVPLALVLAAGCGTMTAVRPLPAGRSALDVSLGGPVAKVSGMDIPMPYLVARYRYGVTDRFGLSASWHVTPVIFGVAAFDGGMNYALLEQRGLLPAAVVAGGITGYVEPGGESRVFPDLDLALSWRYGGRFTSYLGVQSIYQLSRSPHVVFAPVVGQGVTLGRLALGVEAKWYAPTEDTKPRNVDYRLAIGGKGAVGFALGAGWNWGGGR